MKESFVLYTDMEEQFEMLGYEEAGKLMKAIFSYVHRGEANVELTGATKMAFLFIRKILDRDGEKYEQVRQERSRAGRAGGLASAAARKRAKEKDRQEEANVEAVQQREAKEPGAEQNEANQAVSVPVSVSVPDPVNVPDPVSVSVSDPVPVPEKKKKIYGRYKNIFLAQEELLELQREFPADCWERIERLSEYMASTGKYYPSPLAAIRYWAREGKP